MRWEGGREGEETLLQRNVENRLNFLHPCAPTTTQTTQEGTYTHGASAHRLRLPQHGSVSQSPAEMRTDRPGPRGTGGTCGREPPRSVPEPKRGATAPHPVSPPRCAALRGPGLASAPSGSPGGPREPRYPRDLPWEGRRRMRFPAPPREPPGHLWQRVPSDRPAAAPRPAPSSPAGRPGGERPEGVRTRAGAPYLWL